MSEEMDTNADERLDGRYAVDFPLPPSVPPKSDRDCLVIDASCDRNELSFMNDFRDNAYEPTPKDVRCRFLTFRYHGTHGRDLARCRDIVAAQMSNCPLPGKISASGTRFFSFLVCCVRP